MNDIFKIGDKYIAGDSDIVFTIDDIYFDHTVHGRNGQFTDFSSIDNITKVSEQEAIERWNPIKMAIDEALLATVNVDEEEIKQDLVNFITTWDRETAEREQGFLEDPFGGFDEDELE